MDLQSYGDSELGNTKLWRYGVIDLQSYGVRESRVTDINTYRPLNTMSLYFDYNYNILVFFAGEIDPLRTSI